MYKRWREWTNDRWESIGLWGILSGLLIVLSYAWHLGEKPLNPQESQLSSTLSLHSVKTSPIDAPHNLLLLGIKHLGHSGPAAQRLASVIFVLIIIVCFYVILKYWLGRFGAWLGTLLFSFTPLLMLAGRSATAAVMVLFPIVSVAAYMWLIRNKKVTILNLLILTVAAALSIYEPGGYLLLILGVARERQNLSKLFGAVSRPALAINGLVFLVLILPLILAVASQPGLLKPLTLLPHAWPSVLVVIKSIGWGILALFWHSSTHHNLQVGQLAILDGTTIILGLFGTYALWEKAPKKLYPLAFLAILGVIASAINQNYNLLLICLPPILMVAATGLRYLYVEWSRVFPRNPLPRTLAMVILIVLIAAHIVWGAHYSLTAWPHSLPVR